jgi:hypothetical protein
MVVLLHSLVLQDVLVAAAEPVVTPAMAAQEGLVIVLAHKPPLKDLALLQTVVVAQVVVEDGQVLVLVLVVVVLEYTE